MAPDRRVRRVSADERSVTLGSERAIVPSGREARLWRVLVELGGAVEDPKPVLPGRLEKLIVEFDDAYTTFVEGMEQLPSEAQFVALQAVDRQLAAMVRATDAALWTEQALREDTRWSEAGRLIRGVIQAFDWPGRRLSLVAADASVEESGSGRSSAPAISPRREA